MARLMIVSLALALGACGSATTPAENAALAAENRAGLDGDVVELPAGEGEADDDGPAEVPAGNAAIAVADGWVGRWTGPEGLALDIAADEARPGRYDLTMQYTLDDRGEFTGTATPEGIAFTRRDGPQVLRASDGDGTGLKWLAGKQDCLRVRDGEGYCRD
ncbi:hypothetical protein [Sphingomonas baiyangensis]|uniref:Lipoprotein n=1 Tax=Sphingomonas baiyangensis TaxID=2572576 RepID=A0A4U1L0S9_9SPHN|nr:hypothetical protein [Sphingomonas baiyangensis]TKD50359.1 hypothetical protein FBR43_05975 [Sphingomonas baiyangensis]